MQGVPIEGGSSHIDCVKPDGTSRIPGCCALLIDGAVAAFGPPFKRNCLPPEQPMGMLSDCLPRQIVKGLCQRYLKTSISEEQCRESGRLVETTVGQIEAVQFSRTVAFAL
jgi:hypothetical protein